MDLAIGVQVRGLNFSYGKREALKNFSMTLGAGRFTALLGPNGAGKSTLVSLLSNLFAPKPECISVFGMDITGHPRQVLATMGIVFQQSTLDLDLTVRQNMAYFAALHGLGGAVAGQRIDLCLERMDLVNRAGERARNLNGGHRRRLEVARVLLHKPRFLLLDEPTVGLDVASRAALVEYVHRLCRDEGLTVLWATHLVDEVADDDDLVVLHEGEVRAAGPVQDVLAGCGASSVLEAFNKLTSIFGSGTAESDVA
jgi:ABC-2 type transport system ATP-binding protein